MRTKSIPTPEDWPELKYHDLSGLIEFGAGIDLGGVVRHMREHGYDEGEPIILFEGKILDGRHRHRAAIQAEVVPVFRELTGKDPVAFVFKKLLRQHLSGSQRAILAASFANLGRGRPKEIKGSIDPFISESAEKAGEMLHVSEKSVDRALAVINDGTEKLQEAVKGGTISVSDAARVAKEPDKIQDRAVKSVEKGEAKTVSEAAKKIKELLCDRCRRVGPVSDCPGCKRVQAEAKASKNGQPISREPGDDTDIEENEKKGPKPGQPLFDWKPFHQSFGSLVRSIDILYRNYNQINERGAIRDDDPHKELSALLKKFHDKFKERYEALAGQKAPQ